MSNLLAITEWVTPLRRIKRNGPPLRWGVESRVPEREDNGPPRCTSAHSADELTGGTQRGERRRLAFRTMWNCLRAWYRWGY